MFLSKARLLILKLQMCTIKIMAVTDCRLKISAYAVIQPDQNQKPSKNYTAVLRD